jgi:hypothetical protein
VRLEGVATGDVNLAQKIPLESFESKALAIAIMRYRVWERG